MQWLIASLALALCIVLAFTFSQSRKAVFATVAIIALLAAAAGFLFHLENRRSEQRARHIRALVKPRDIDITDATFTSEYRSWHLRGTLVNHSAHTIAGLTLAVRVSDCPAPAPCQTIGEADTSTDGLDVPPRGTQRLDLIVDLPDMPPPRAMKWNYIVKEVRAARE